jgi:hypothetical protein
VVPFSRRVFSRGQSREAVRHVVLPQLQVSQPGAPLPAKPASSFTPNPIASPDSAREETRPPLRLDQSPNCAHPRSVVSFREL